MHADQGLLTTADASTAEPSLRTSADAAPQSQAPPVFVFPLPSVQAEAVFALHYALFGCAKACVRLAAAVAAAASSSQAWHLDFRIGRCEGSPLSSQFV